MSKIQETNCSEIIPGNNDRKKFVSGDLESLAASIKDSGLAQPITVRPIESETHKFEIVAGERRFRAISEILEWGTIPAIVKELTDQEASDIMLAENTGRSDLDPVEEAFAFQSRIDKWEYDIDTLADKAGVSTIYVRFRLKLLNIRPELQKLVSSGDLDLGYAQILADGELDTNRQMIAIARLRQNPKPTPSWFRAEVNTLKEEQAQNTLFDLPIISGKALEQIEAEEFEFPPLPSEDQPPAVTGSAREVIESHIAFWNQAAADWDHLGKSFKRNECLAAAAALKSALVSL